MKKIILICTLFLIHFAFGQQTPDKFTLEMDYLTYTPQGYNEDVEKKWPLVVFLHGSGEQGNDLEKIKVHGPPMLVEQGKQFPFLLISPQAKKGWDEDFLIAMVKDFVEKHRVDENRIYLTGLSMGGYGTWRLATKYPNYFAAIAPICGGGDPREAWKLRHTPVWCFHGALDGVVPLSSSENMVNALKPYNPNVKFTVYPDVYHDSWIKTYNNPELYEWMLKQRRHVHKRVDLDSAKLGSYEGKYKMEENGQTSTLSISQKEGNLMVDLQGRQITLIPSGEGWFFLDKNHPMELQFVTSEDGKVSEIIIYEQELMHLPRIE